MDFVAIGFWIPGRETPRRLTAVEIAKDVSRPGNAQNPKATKTVTPPQAPAWRPERVRSCRRTSPNRGD